MSEGKPRPRPVPVQAVNLPGLGASAPRPGQVLPGAGPTGPALQVPNTAQAVRAVDTVSYTHLTLPTNREV